MSDRAVPRVAIPTTDARDAAQGRAPSPSSSGSGQRSRARWWLPCRVIALVDLSREPRTCKRHPGPAPLNTGTASRSGTISPAPARRPRTWLPRARPASSAAVAAHRNSYHDIGSGAAAASRVPRASSAAGGLPSTPDGLSPGTCVPIPIAGRPAKARARGTPACAPRSGRGQGRAGFLGASNTR